MAWVPRWQRPTYSQRIHNILCRISRRRRIEKEEAEAIALRRAEKISWDAWLVVRNMQRNWWWYGGRRWYYRDGELRWHNTTTYQDIEEAIRERRPFEWANATPEQKEEGLFQSKLQDLYQLQNTLSLLRKEIRNECNATQ